VSADIDLLWSGRSIPSTKANDPLPAEIPAAETTEADEIPRRASLLADYRSVTGVSEYFIYTHAKSGIHKPQFRQWKNGTLKAGSATTENLERFLLEKTVPPPRREKR
jgi:hypothetical protein